MDLRIFTLLTGMAAALWGLPAQAIPLNEWSISCGVDKGAITRSRDAWIFRTSSNHCSGGIFKQRAEISSEHVPPTIRGAYLFSSTVTMSSPVAEKFDIFQLHDGRDGCAPPLKVTVLRSGQIELTSDIKTGSGESCVRGKLGNAASRGTIRHDGTAQKLEVLIVFDGRGGFDATVRIDGQTAISGRYDQPTAPGAFRSTKFYFKHGIYSQRSFPYEMQSRGMKVTRVRLAN